MDNDTFFRPEQSFVQQIPDRCGRTERSSSNSDGVSDKNDLHCITARS
jgi:hypothetical protein